MVKQLGAILCATIATDALDRAVGLYEAELGYRRIAQAPLDPALAAGWGAPAAAGSRMVQLAPPGPDGTVLRFVERPRPAGYAAMRTCGWNALEFLVRDPDGLSAKLLAAGLEMLGPPADLAAYPAIRATQFRDPADVCIYLTRVGDAAAAAVGLPQARTEIDRVFVTVLGAADIEATLGFYRATFGMTIDDPATTRITVLSAAHDLDRSTEHKLTVMPLGDGYLIEIDQYPATATARPAVPGDLAPGVCILSFAARHGAVDAAYVTRIGVQDRPASFRTGPDSEGIELVLST